MHNAIRALNRLHYSAETSYYTAAPLRSVERALADSVTASARVLDVGCGSGRVVSPLTSMGINIVGIDMVEPCLQAAKTRLGPDPRLVCGDMASLPFSDHSFNEVWCLRFSFNALSAPEDRKAALQEMVRICRPGGRVLVESFNLLYAGPLGTMWLANLFDEASRRLRRLAGSASPRLPTGDILYLASKSEDACPGFAHLPTPSELRRLIRSAVPDAKWRLCAESELFSSSRGNRSFLFGYSMWIVINP
jgi:SAM-dependent methyltransferase